MQQNMLTDSVNMKHMKNANDIYTPAINNSTFLPGIKKLLQFNKWKSSLAQQTFYVKIPHFLRKILNRTATDFPNTQFTK